MSQFVSAEHGEQPIFQELLAEAIPKLTRSQKKLAELIRRDLSILAFEPALRIGSRVGVSEATVHRLALRLGFTSFSDMQRCAQHNFTENRTVSRFQRVSELGLENRPILRDLIETDILNLEATLNNTEEAEIWKGAELIAHARNVYIAGWRAGLPVTMGLSYTLNLMLGNTVLLPMHSGLQEAMCFMTERDVLVVSGLPRYCKVTLDTMEYARRLGMKTISITDTPSSPFVPLSTIVYYVSTYSTGFLDSYTASIAISNALIMAVSLMRQEDVNCNLRKLEQFIGK